MSAKRSFDLERKASTPKKVKVERKAAPRVPRRKPSLRARREAAQNATTSVVVFVIALVVCGVVYGLWRPEVRIADVAANDVPDPERAAALVKETIDGKYAGVLPRDSTFFYPEKDVRAAVLDAFPSLAAISISRGSFSSLSIDGTRRVAAFYWCGESAASFSVSGTGCYEADVEGLVFAPADTMQAGNATSAPLLRIYAPLERIDSASYPIRGMVVGAEYLPNLLQFVKAVKTLGIPVLATSIEGDEAELFITPETRIKYVLGNEEEAAKSAHAAFPNLNFMNGTIEYVDLRFDGKLYVKRYE